MRKRRSPFPKDGKFKFEKVLKVYLRNLTGGDVTDAPDPIGAIAVKRKDFVKFVVRLASSPWSCVILTMHIESVFYL